MKEDLHGKEAHLGSVQTAADHRFSSRVPPTSQIYCQKGHEGELENRIRFFAEIFDSGSCTTGNDIAAFRLIKDFLFVQPPFYKIGHSLIRDVVLGLNFNVTGNFGILKEAFKVDPRCSLLRN